MVRAGEYLKGWPGILVARWLGSSVARWLSSLVARLLSPSQLETSSLLCMYRRARKHINQLVKCYSLPVRVVMTFYFVELDCPYQIKSNSSPCAACFLLCIEMKERKENHSQALCSGMLFIIHGNTLPPRCYAHCRSDLTAKL